MQSDRRPLVDFILEPERSKASRTRALRLGLLVALTSLAWLTAAPVLAQSDAEVEGARAAAAEAEQEAQRAQEAARAARERVEALEASQREVEARAAEEERARSDAQAAADEARRAAAAAQAAAAEAREVLQAFEQRYARRGLYLGGNVAYAAENIEDGNLVVKSSLGAGAWLGYRANDYFAVELRGELTDGFDVSADFYNPRTDSFEPGKAEFRTQAYTLNVKGYLLQKSFQPYLSFGFGALHAEADVDFDSGTNEDAGDDTSALVRVSGGIDYYVSESLVVNLDAAYLVPSGDLDFLEYALLGAGVTFRF